MKKIFGLIIGSFIGLSVSLEGFCADKFDIIPDLPEPLAAAQASSITTPTNEAVVNTAQSISPEPNFLSVVLSLIFVILLIYATGIIYAKLNRAGFRTLKKQIGDLDSSRVTVVSTTPLGNNKTLHVVELDGKRMLIGASANSIDLIKDLGTYPPLDINEGEFSKIEIPNIRIPKIEIPKIEFPNIGFTKAFKNNNQEGNKGENNEENQQVSDENNNNFTISEIYEESPDGIIDKLFTQSEQKKQEEQQSVEENKNNEYKHSVDPDEYALYKKYL